MMSNERKAKLAARRKKLAVQLGIILILVIAAVVASVKCGDLLSSDRRFIRSLNRGLYEGLKLGSDESDIRDIDGKPDLSFIEAEYNEVKQFEQAEFRNKELGELAEAYITALSDCCRIISDKKAAKDYSKFWANFSEPYGRRLLALYELSKGGYGMTSGEPDHKKELDEILFQGWAVSKTSEIVFERNNKKSKKKELTANVINDSGYELQYMDITVDLYSGSKKIETVSAYAENIGKDEKFSLKCYQSGDKEATSYIITAINCAIAE